MDLMYFAYIGYKLLYVLVKHLYSRTVLVLVLKILTLIFGTRQKHSCNFEEMSAEMHESNVQSFLLTVSNHLPSRHSARNVGSLRLVSGFQLHLLNLIGNKDRANVTSVIVY